jgi:hypothetical protein
MPDVLSCSQLEIGVEMGFSRTLDEGVLLARIMGLVDSSLNCGQEPTWAGGRGADSNVLARQSIAPV